MKMKTLQIVAMLMLSYLAVKAQSKYEVYCELLAEQKGLFTRKIKIRVDFGQKATWWKGIEILKDDKEKALVFNSVIDALNYMAKADWKLVNAFPVSYKNQNVYHYVFKKEISE